MSEHERTPADAIRQAIRTQDVRLAEGCAEQMRDSLGWGFGQVNEAVEKAAPGKMLEWEELMYAIS